MENHLKDAKAELDSFHQQKSVSQDQKEISLAKDYLSWIKKKTSMVLNEKNFSLPEDIKLWEIKRGSVFWFEFGYNIDEEFGGRHPALVLRRGGNTVIVLPLSTQEPTEDQKKSGIYVELPKVWGFRNMTRWVNVLNATPISIQRIDFSSNRGNVKGPDLDNINEAMANAGLWSIKKQKPVAAAAKPKSDAKTL